LISDWGRNVLAVGYVVKRGRGDTLASIYTLSC
jgi:hypothetical protein